MLIVLLLLLAAVAAAALALLWLVVRGHNKRLLLAGSHAVASDTPGGIGISVLCSGVHAQEQVENLLSAEYAHYEVIVVLDSLRYPVEFAAFTARYRMIRVEYALSEELPVTGVRALDRRAGRVAEPRSRRCGRRFCAPSGQSRSVAPAAEPLGAGFLYAPVCAQAAYWFAGSSACRAGCGAGRCDRRRRMDGPVAGGCRAAHRSPRVVRRRMCFVGP